MYLSLSPGAPDFVHIPLVSKPTNCPVRGLFNTQSAYVDIDPFDLIRRQRTLEARHFSFAVRDNPYPACGADPAFS